MAVISLNQNNFQKVVTDADATGLVDFYADWCGPCKMLSPIVDQIAEEHPEITVGKVNIDECAELAERFGIMGVPTLLVFRKGKLAGKSVGFKPKKALESFLEE